MSLTRVSEGLLSESNVGGLKSEGGGYVRLGSVGLDDSAQSHDDLRNTQLNQRPTGSEV